MLKKTVALNQAIDSYVELAQKCANSEWLSSTKKIKKEHVSFFESYYSLRKNKSILKFLNELKTDWYFPKKEQLFIEYKEEAQARAFVHLLVEMIDEKKIPLNFSEYSNTDFAALHYGLSNLLLVGESNVCTNFISLLGKETLDNIDELVAIEFQRLSFDKDTAGFGSDYIKSILKLLIKNKQLKKSFFRKKNITREKVISEIKKQNQIQTKYFELKSSKKKPF